MSGPAVTGPGQQQLRTEPAGSLPGLQQADPQLRRVITWRPQHLGLARCDLVEHVKAVDLLGDLQVQRGIRHIGGLHDPAEPPLVLGRTVLRDIGEGSPTILPKMGPAVGTRSRACCRALARYRRSIRQKRQNRKTTDASAMESSEVIHPLMAPQETSIPRHRVSSLGGTLHGLRRKNSSTMPPGSRARLAFLSR